MRDGIIAFKIGPCTSELYRDMNPNESDGVVVHALTALPTVATPENSALHASAASGFESHSSRFGADASLNVPAGSTALPSSAPATTPPPPEN